MKVLVTGASSFVGDHFCRMASRKHHVIGQFFSTPILLPHIQKLRLDLTHSLAGKKLAEENADIVVHIACKIKGSPLEGETVATAAFRENQKMMTQVLSVGKPIVYASSTVVHWSVDVPYVRSRRADEERLMESGLDYVILRPSAPYGPKLSVHCPKHKESFHTLVDTLRRFPVVPMVGNGQYRRQPVHVDDLSQVILDCIDRERLPNRAFDVGGEKAYPFSEIISLLNNELKLNRRIVSLPKKWMVLVAKWIPNLEPSLIDSIDQDEVANIDELLAYLGWSPRDFSKGMKDLLS